MKQDTMKKVLLGLSSVVLATSTGVAVWVLLRSRWYNEKKTYEKISKLASDLNELLINHPDREKIRDLLKLEQSKENRIKLEDEIKKMLVKEADERKNILDHINQINDPKKRQALLDELKEAKTWDVRSEILEKAKKQIAKEWEKKIKDKSDFAKSIIDQIKDDAVKQNLLDRLSKETEHDDETLTDIDTIAKEAQQQVAKETNDAIEAIKAKMMELAYPGGVNANGTQDVINKLNAIQNSDNDDKTKMALAEKIANTFDDHNNKIKEVKAEIEKLEPSKQQVLLDKLDNAKFLHDDLNKTKEFDSLLNEVKALQDAELAEFTKGINALENLSPEEKQEFINSLPKGSSDAEIKNKLKEAYKKDLENFIKKMDYPAKPDSAAQDALIQALTDNPEKYADNEKYLEELNRLKELSKLVDNANDSLNTIEGDKTALIEEFNNADTKEELEALLQHIADEKHKEVLAAKRAKISSIIDSLPYPEGSDAAKNELKAAYANENLTFTQLEQKEQEIREKIEPKVSEAKKKISKLSSDDQTRLNEEFKNAGSEEKLDALLAKINEAFNNSKEAQKSVIDDLTHLTHEQKEALKNQIDQATDFADIRKIVDRAQLLDKIEEAKSIITPESYALDENPEVKAIIDETIKSLKNQIEGLDAEDEVVAKKAELDELNKKLKDYKKQIEALTENEVNNPAETKVDLAKDLAKISNKDQFPNLDLEIAKAKLKKVASDLDYPGKPNNAAIKELQAQIEAVTTQDKLTELDNRIKNELPAKIAEAKAKIAAVRDSETTTRKQDLNRQLDEADTDEEFDALFKNIEKYKAQGDVEYSGKLKERLKEQAARLPYPGPDVPAKTALERKIEAETDIAELEKLQNETIPSMLNKINELKEEIAKRSPENIAKLNEKLNNASTPEELAAIDAEITKAINDEKAAIAAKIDALAHLTPEQKDAAKAKLDNKTYSEMDDVLERAKRDNLLALVNKLGYNDSETLPAPARTSLRSEVETAAESELDNKLTELEALKTAIENEKAEIDQINYSSDDAEGKNDLKERLNNLTTAASVNSLVDPSEVNNKLSTYKDIINDVNNPLSTIQKSDLTSELDKLPKNGAEKALRKEIFDAKKNAAIVAINALPSLTEERKRQLINDLPSWTDSLGSGNVDEFKNKIDEINSKIVDSRKEDLKAKIDALPFTGDAATTKQSLKNAVDSITNEATYNAQKDLLDRYKDELVRTKNKINQVQDQAEKNHY
ncbi:hypothetical protein [Mycoplasmopsis edwardii]|uniref:Uncharacterized protein n=1 Tax=Mycoplasmopsis edwardii TaxID=53558 RepID=A0ACD4PGI8_9BACT|nr:hypothetical protein [Mycoplasmopsis edwardii]WBP83745.1 hypothetical protein Me_995_000364 [Mycoplasmopsis edwardii]